MANYNPGSGKWEVKGGGEFDTRHQAEARENYDKNNSGGFGDGMADAIGTAAGNALWKIILIIPYLIAFVVGSLITLILKLGIVGKVILTSLTIFFMYIFVYIFSAGLPNAGLAWLQEVLSWLLAVLAGAWFWFMHYKVVKRFPWENYIKLVFDFMKVFFIIPILFLVAYIVYYALVMGALIDGTYSKVINNMAAPIAFGVAFLIAVAYWFIKLYKYREPGTEDQQQPIVKKNAVEQPVSIPISGEQPTSLSDGMQRYSVGDFVWAAKKSGKKLYFARIEDTSNASVMVVFYDGKQEEVNKDAVFYLNEAQQAGLTPHGNWKNGGVFYKCNMLKLNKNSVLVKYTTDDVEEELPYNRLMFKK